MAKDKVNQFKEEFGMAVRRHRNKMGLSQEDYADKANLHRTYISAVELGKVDVGLGTAYKLASALEMPTSKLIREAELHISPDS